MDSESRWVTREELYRELWEHPAKIVCQRYGISDVALAKGCRKWGVPIPGRGYWARKAAGKYARQIPLPSMSATNHFYPNWQRLDASERQALIDAKAARKRLLSEMPRIEAARVSTEPHALVRSVGPKLRKAARDYKGLRSAPSGYLNIEVSDESQERALSLLSLLLHLLQANGIELRAGSANEAPMIAVSGVAMALSLTENVRRTKHEPTAAEEKARQRYWNNRSGTDPQIPDFDYHAMGLLTISVSGGYPRRKWNDTARKALEVRIPEIVAELFVFADEIRRERERQAMEAARRKKLYAEYSAKVERRKEEAALLRGLRQEAKQWSQAQKIRTYADAVERAAIAAGTSAEVADWLAWARAKADCLDPTIEICDLILDAPEPEPSW